MISAHLTCLENKKRIEETLASTKRWHHYHRTTKLNDDQFVAAYLNKQAKRDTAMAGLLQRELQKHVRDRLPRTTRPPTSLAEFCRDVNWEDVKEVVQNVLVRDRKRVSENLR